MNQLLSKIKLWPFHNMIFGRLTFNPWFLEYHFVKRTIVNESDVKKHITHLFVDENNNVRAEESKQ